MIALSDIAAVEYRVAQLSDAEHPPAAANPNAAFGALLAASAARAAAGAPSAPASCPVPAVELERA
jgi:hypothetical protein